MQRTVGKVACDTCCCCLQGPYEYLGSFRPHGQQARDLTLFQARPAALAWAGHAAAGGAPADQLRVQDDDEAAYLAYSSENNMVRGQKLLHA